MGRDILLALSRRSMVWDCVRVRDRIRRRHRPSRSHSSTRIRVRVHKHRLVHHRTLLRLKRVRRRRQVVLLLFLRRQPLVETLRHCLLSCSRARSRSRGGAATGSVKILHVILRAMGPVILEVLHRERFLQGPLPAQDVAREARDAHVPVYGEHKCAFMSAMMNYREG